MWAGGESLIAGATINFIFTLAGLLTLFNVAQMYATVASHTVVADFYTNSRLKGEQVRGRFICH